MPAILPEDESAELIRALRWRDGLRCPRCGSTAVGSGGLQRHHLRGYRCRGCGRGFNDLTGTPLARRHLSPSEWCYLVQSLAAGRTLRDVCRRLEGCPSYPALLRAVAALRRGVEAGSACPAELLTELRSRLVEMDYRSSARRRLLDRFRKEGGQDDDGDGETHNEYVKSWAIS